MKRAALVLTLFLGAAALLVNYRHRLGPSGGLANPIAQYVLPAKSRFALAGRIEDRIPAGSYVYFRVRDPSGASHWIVTLGSCAASRGDVEATIYARAESFYSRRLGRDFAPLFFGTVHAAVPDGTSNDKAKKETP